MKSDEEPAGIETAQAKNVLLERSVRIVQPARGTGYAPVFLSVTVTFAASFAISIPSAILSETGWIT